MAKRPSLPTRLTHLDAYDADSGELNVIVETPKGRRNKFTYDEETGLFKLGGVLPAGAVFPFDFGFVPSTLGGDGDPLDVLLLMDEPAFPGCLVRARLIGVIEDRLIAVAEKSRDHRDVRSLGDLSRRLLEEIEHFFVSYNEVKGKVFKPRGRFGPARAEKLVEQGMERISRQNSRSGKKRRVGSKKKR
jgi:inorganic pyrophosphatase